ncbi:uncharacterized protein LOC117293701 [Asterias rubens]|uniref:uncharacterized protein LOC117293701 n=1 Tax=Asterias rubens TaxID=7604 RepID=UPI001454F436|nr:uncharacterized protein LOC117293701 [Asterias rubens]
MKGKDDEMREEAVLSCDENVSHNVPSSIKVTKSCHSRKVSELQGKDGEMREEAVLSCDENVSHNVPSSIKVTKSCHSRKVSELQGKDGEMREEAVLSCDDNVSHNVPSSIKVTNRRRSRKIAGLQETDDDEMRDEDEGTCTDDQDIDDTPSQKRHNIALQTELKKKTPNSKSVDVLFQKGSKDRIEWIHKLNGGTRAKDVLVVYPCYSKASVVSNLQFNSCLLINTTSTSVL